MKKILLLLWTLAAILLMSNCNKITRYTISEQTINQSLKKQSQYQKKLSVDNLLTADITLTELVSQIGRSAPDKVTLQGRANLTFSSLLGSQQASLALTLQALPVFDSKKGAIFLHELTILNSEAEPKKVAPLLKHLTPYLNRSLKAWFNQHPVYVLSHQRSKTEAIAKTLVRELEVKLGELIIHFTD